MTYKEKEQKLQIMADIIRMTQDEWLQKGTELFGEHVRHWRFVCPSCGNIQTPLQFKEIGANPDQAYFNCIGRYTGTTNEMFSKTPPCNYTSGGLICISPLIVTTPDGKEHHSFAFDETNEEICANG